MANKNTRKVVAAKASGFRKAAVSAGIQAHSGKRAMKAEYREAISVDADWIHTDSVDLDTHFKDAEPNEPRWDYGLGVRRAKAELVFWIEPHPASSTGEVSHVVNKVKWLKEKLKSGEFRDLSALTDDTAKKGYSPFCWVHSGALKIIANSKEAKILAQHGIKLPTRRLELPVK